jgi:hypothetical protein
MGWALNNITAPDSYTQTATLAHLPPIARINLDVANNAIYWQLQQARGTGLYTEGGWGPEVYMAPGSRSLYRPGTTGIRIRAAIPAAQLPAGAQQAQVTIEAIG